MDKKESGIVYFFRHKGLSPVKVGFSSKSDYRGRFNKFNMYSPYGAEVLAIIASDNPAELEKRIHNEIKSFQVRGEFFDITIEKINELVNRFSTNEQLELMKRIAKSISMEYTKSDRWMSVEASPIETEKFNTEILSNLKNSCLILDCDKKTFKDFAEQNEICNKVYRIGSAQIRGFRFFIEENLYLNKKTDLKIFKIK